MNAVRNAVRRTPGDRPGGAAAPVAGAAGARSWRQGVLDMGDRVPGATTAAVRIATAAITLDELAEPRRGSNLQVGPVFDGFLEELSDAGYLGR